MRKVQFIRRYGSDKADEKPVSLICLNRLKKQGATDWNVKQNCISL